MSGRKQTALIALSFVAFVSLGLPDGVLSVAWPSVRGAFDVPISRLGALLPFGTAAYVLASSMSGPFERRFGVGPLLVSSTAIGCLGLVVFALAPSWWWLILAMTLGGLGAGGIDAGLNAFAADRFGPRVVTWLHASWGVGATAGPLLMTSVFMLGLSWRWGYAALAGVMVVLTLFFALTLRLWRLPHHENESDRAERASMRSTLRLPTVWLQLGVFATYCGLEAGAGQLMYSVLVEGRGVTEGVAGLVIGGYWGALTVGRIVFGQVAARVSSDAILRFGTVVAPIGVALFWWNVSDWVSFAGIWLLGGALAPIFPMMVSLTPARLGSTHSPNAVGLQISAAAIGFATLPGSAALLMRHGGLELLGPFLLGLAIAIALLNEAAGRLARRRAGPV